MSSCSVTRRCCFAIHILGQTHTEHWQQVQMGYLVKTVRHSPKTMHGTLNMTTLKLTVSLKCPTDIDNGTHSVTVVVENNHGPGLHGKTTCRLVIDLQRHNGMYLTLAVGAKSSPGKHSASSPPWFRKSTRGSSMCTAVPPSLPAVPKVLECTTCSAHMHSGTHGISRCPSLSWLRT